MRTAESGRTLSHPKKFWENRPQKKKKIIITQRVKQNVLCMVGCQGEKEKKKSGESASKEQGHKGSQGYFGKCRG